MSEGGYKLSTQYKEAAEAIPSNYVLLSSGGKVRADNNRGDRRSAGDGRGCGNDRVSI